MSYIEGSLFGGSEWLDFQWLCYCLSDKRLLYIELKNEGARAKGDERRSGSGSLCGAEGGGAAKHGTVERG